MIVYYELTTTITTTTVTITKTMINTTKTKLTMTAITTGEKNNCNIRIAALANATGRSELYIVYLDMYIE